MRHAATLLVASVVLGGASHGVSAAGVHQDRPAAQRPASPAHERLGVFEGTWTRSDVPPGTTFTDTCAWMAGARRHMVCRQRSESATSVREQMAIYSYRAADSTYLLTVLLAGGQVWRYEGGPEGEQWVFHPVGNRPDPSRRLRQVITPAADTLHFLEQLSEHGGPWRLTDPSEDFRYVRLPGGRQ